MEIGIFWADFEVCWSKMQNCPYDYVFFLAMKKTTWDDVGGGFARAGVDRLAKPRPPTPDPDPDPDPDTDADAGLALEALPELIDQL